MISVLYVDDEPGLLELGKLFLERDGRFSVDTVMSAPEALAAIRTRSYDAIISDYQMPDMNGIEFLQRVRASGNTIPFIIFTGRGREEVVIQALNEGADFYIQKGGEPVSQFTELAHKVRKAVLQRRAEASIQDHERRETDIINFLPDATFAIDTNGIVIAWNRAMEKMTGVQSSEILGKDNYEYALPFYNERRKILIDLVLSDDPATESLYPYVTRAGNKLFSEITIPHMNKGRGAALWFTASPLYDTKGRLVGAIESIRDVTERKKAEAALNESEKRFRELSELLPQAVYEADVDGTLTYANRIAFDLFGHSKDEVLYRLTVHDMIAPEESEQAKDAVRNMLEGRTPPGQGGEFMARKKDGHTFPVSIYSSPIVTDGRITGFRGIIVDMTAWKQTEEKLIQSEIRFRSLIQNSSDMIRILDREGKVVYESPSTVTIMGYQAGENIGKDPLAFVHPDDLERVKTDLREVYSHTNPGISTEFRARKADGTYIWVDTIAMNLLDVPAVNGLVITTRPIDQRKKMEDAIRESEEKYRTVFETTGAATVLIENDATISLANTEFEHLSGFTKEEIENKKKWTEFVVQEDLDRMLAQHRLRRQERQRALTHYEFRFIPRSKEPRNIFLTIDVIPGTTKSVASLLDITERKKAEDSLIAANREYQNLLEQIQDIYYRADSEGRLVKASQSWSKLLGYHDVSECLGKYIAEDFYLNPEDRKTFLEEVYRDGKVTDYEVLLKKKDGSPVLVSTSSHLYYGSSGNIIGIEGTFRDITERKRQDHILRTQLNLGLALQEKRGLQGTLMTCLLAAINIADMDAGGIYLVNEASGSVDLMVSENLGDEFVRSVSHYPAGSVNARIVTAGKPVYAQFSKTGIDLTPAMEREGLKALALIPIVYGGRAIACINVTSHTVDEIPADARVGLETIATQMGAAIERIRADEALAESEQRYRNVVEDQTELISRFLPDGTHVFVNEAYCRYFGLSREGILGHRFQPLIPPEDRERVQRFFESLTPDHPIDIIEHRIIMPDGSVRWQRWSDRAIFDASGAIVEYQSVGRDVTEKKGYEEALRQANVVVENSPVVAFRWKAAEGWPVEFVSNNVTRFGYTPEELLSGTIPFAAMVHPDDLARVSGEVKKYSDEGTDEFRQEYRLVTRDKRVLWVDDRMVIGRDQDGGITHYQGILIDITDQKRSEDLVRESEEKYRALVEYSNDGVFIVQDGRLAFYNRAFAEMTGYDEEELIGRPIAGTIAPEDRDMVIARYHERGLGGPVPESYEFSILHKDGANRVRIRVYAGVGSYRGRPAIIGTFHNITEEHKREKALVESEGRYRSLSEASHDLIFVIDRAGRVTYINSSAAEMMRMPAQEIIGRERGCLFPPEISERQGQAIRGVFTTGEQSRSTGKLVFGGRTFWFDHSLVPVRDSAGIISHVLGISRDITDIKRAEDAIREANRKINLLTSITRHDVANQVTILKGFARIALLKKPDPVVADLIAKIDAAGTAIARQIEFTKTYQELGLHSPAWYRVREIIAKQKRDGVALSCSCDAEIFADPMLEKVFFNLIDNAIRHGERVTAVGVMCERQGDELVIIVADDGAGIPFDKKEKVFEKGYGKNTGFGLFLAREILSITGITIRETGLPGKGARFEMIVPKGVYRFG